MMRILRILRTALSPLTSPGDRPTSSPLSHVTHSHHHSHSLNLRSRSRSLREVLGSLSSNTWNNKVRLHVNHTLAMHYCVFYIIGSLLQVSCNHTLLINSNRLVSLYHTATPSHSTSIHCVAIIEWKSNEAMHRIYS